MKNSNIRTINLALQGGGAHGAFTWGVLDRLLQEEQLEFEGISGTSAGAMNAVMVAYGMLNGGREGARALLSEFWQKMSGKALPDSTLVGVDCLPSMDLSPAFSMLRTLGWFLSPYQFNPMAFDPLRKTVTELVNFQSLREASPIKLFVAATHVRTGKIRVFNTEEISCDAVLASACLPSIHHAVIIDEEPYWDGSFSGNPAIYPLIHHCQSGDIIVVMLAPLQTDEHPTTAESIRQRSRDLMFNGAFLREMRAIAEIKEHYANGLITLGKLERRVRNTHIHLIEAEDLMKSLSHSSKLNTSEAFLNSLFDEGQGYAQKWLDQHADFIGKKSSIDMVEVFA